MSDHGKVALITGANKGIGFETARQLGREGVTVLVGARSLEKAEQAAAKLRGEGIQAEPVKLDVTSEADRKAAAQQIESKYGKLDILVNNAGIMVEQTWAANDSDKVSVDTLRQTFETNFFAPVALTQEMLPLLKKAPAARIVNLSSILGSLTHHGDRKSPIYNSKPLGYNASKTALNAFTVHLAHALRGTKIKVNSAHPGWVKTDMGTDAAPMNVEDGAKTTVALALAGDDSPNGAYIHLGQTLPW